MGDEEGYTTANKWAELKAFALAALTRHHAAEPLSPGLEMEELRSRLPYEIGARNYRALADRLARETDIVREESTLRLKTHRVKIGESDGKLVARIEDELRKAGFQPPELKQLAEALKLPAAEVGKLRSVLSALEREGKVVKIATDLYFARASVDAARAHLTGYLQQHPEITAGGLSRPARRVAQVCDRAARLLRSFGRDHARRRRAQAARESLLTPASRAFGEPLKRRMPSA